MKLTFIGADHEVTGSCHYLNAAGKNILVDYGMEQGGNVYENAELPIPFSDVDYIFITHAHIDHTGLLPLIYAKGFKGQIFATQATCDLCNIMLKDSAHIQEMEAEWKNRKARRAGNPEVQALYTCLLYTSDLRLIRQDDSVAPLAHLHQGVSHLLVLFLHLGRFL